MSFLHYSMRAQQQPPRDLLLFWYLKHLCLCPYRYDWRRVRGRVLMYAQFGGCWCPVLIPGFNWAIRQMIIHTDLIDCDFGYSFKYGFIPCSGIFMPCVWWFHETVGTGQALIPAPLHVSWRVRKECNISNLDDNQMKNDVYWIKISVISLLYYACVPGDPSVIRFCFPAALQRSRKPKDWFILRLGSGAMCPTYTWTPLTRALTDLILMYKFKWVLKSVRRAIVPLLLRREAAEDVVVMVTYAAALVPSIISVTHRASMREVCGHTSNSLMKHWFWAAPAPSTPVTPL